MILKMLSVLGLICVCGVTNAEKIDKFKIGARHRLSPYLLGIHHNVGNKIGKNIVYNSPENISFLKNMNLQIVRGPSGTGGNYFLWKRGAIMTPNDPMYKKYYGEWSCALVRNAKKDPPLTVKDIYRTAALLDVPYCFNLNIVSQDAENIYELVKKASSLSKKQLFFELGNEFYSIHFKHVFPTVRDYIKRGRLISKAIKRADPEAKVGVVGFNPVLYQRIIRDPNNYKKSDKEDWEFTQAGRVAKWAATIAAEPDFYDAVIIHYYNRVRKLEPFDTPDKLMNHFYAENAFFSESMHQEAKRFPGKEFWLTEWGIMNVAVLRAKGKQQDAYMINKSPAFAIVIGDLLCRMSRDPNITLSTYHSSISANGFGAMQRIKTGKDAGKLTALPVFHLFKALGRMFKECDTFYALQPVDKSDVIERQLTGLKRKVKYSPVGAFGYGTASGMTHAVLINRTAQTRTIEIPGYIAGSGWSYGTDLFPDGYLNRTVKWTEPAVNNIEPKLFRHSTPQRLIKLKPFEMRIIKLTQTSK